MKVSGSNTCLPIGIGQYDDAYAQCDCLWGHHPSSLVRQFVQGSETSDDYAVLDAGCGEGKNAVYVASKTAGQVLALDVSQLALDNACGLDRVKENLHYVCADVRSYSFSSSFDLIIANGVFHCLSSKKQVTDLIWKLKALLTNNGILVMSAFNERITAVKGHSSKFKPTLLPHKFYSDQFIDMELLHLSDRDLQDWHPHTKIPHCHSITRLVARNS